MTAQNAAVQKQKMHQRITGVHLLTAKIEQDPHLQFLIFMHCAFLIQCKFTRNPELHVGTYSLQNMRAYVLYQYL